MKSPRIDAEDMAAFAAEHDLHRPTLLAMMASLDEKIGKVLGEKGVRNLFQNRC